MPKVAILLTNGYADWECAYLNGIGSAYYGVKTFNVSPDGKNIVSLGGLQTIPDGKLGDIKPEEFDALVICGGAIWTTPDAPNIKEIAEKFLDSDKCVAGICGGTLALANAGILNDIKHTSNDLNFLTTSPAYTGQSNYVDTPTAVIDQNVITASGNATAHFTAEIFRAVGVDKESVSYLLSTLAEEHRDNEL